MGGGGWWVVVSGVGFWWWLVGGGSRSNISIVRSQQGLGVMSKGSAALAVRPGNS